jgi:hypothetical protein
MFYPLWPQLLRPQFSDIYSKLPAIKLNFWLFKQLKLREKLTGFLISTNVSVDHVVEIIKVE